MLGTGRIAAAMAVAVISTAAAAQDQGPLSCSFSSNDPAAGCDPETSQISCGFMDALTEPVVAINCDVVANGAVVETVTLNQGYCEYFPSAASGGKFDHLGFQALSYVDRAKIMVPVIFEITQIVQKYIETNSEVQTFLQLQMISGQFNPDGQATVHQMAKLYSDLLIQVIASNPQNFGDFQPVYEKIMALPLGNGGAFSDLVATDKNFPGGVAAISEFLAFQGDLIGPRRYGEKVSFPVRYCDNVLEYSIKVNDQDWVWKNF
jgi:hypothetical protein